MERLTNYIAGMNLHVALFKFNYILLFSLYHYYVKANYLNVFFRSEFDKCKEKFLREEDVPNTNLPLRTVAKEAAIGTGQGFMRCVCKKGCMSKRCLCKKSGYLCNSKCHDSFSCNNKKILILFNLSLTD